MLSLEQSVRVDFLKEASEVAEDQSRPLWILSNCLSVRSRIYDNGFYQKQFD